MSTTLKYEGLNFANFDTNNSNNIIIEFLIIIFHYVYFMIVLMCVKLLKRKLIYDI